MSPLTFALLLLLSFACTALAAPLADNRGRSRRAWMWAGALLGPVPLLLLIMLPRIEGKA
jgi:hypothetical protein